MMVTLGDTNYQTYKEKDIREKYDYLDFNTTNFHFGAFRIFKFEPITDPETNITWSAENITQLMEFKAGFVEINETTQEKDYTFIDVNKCTEKDFKPFIEISEEFNPEGIGMGRE